MSQFVLPSLSVAQMYEVDRLLIDTYGIVLLQTMENAGRNLAQLAKELLDDDLADRPVVLLAGRGLNGGGGLVAARHLANWGAWVQVLLTHPAEQFTGASAHQLEILNIMDVPVAWAEDGWELPPADLVIDALIGCGLQGKPRGKMRDLIQLANSTVGPILSLDVPSGVDVEGGTLGTPYIRATATMTLALPKQGLLTAAVQTAIGALYLADLGVPPTLYEHLGLTVPPLFAANTILPVTVENEIGLIYL